MNDIKHWSGENATRFNTKPPTNKKQLLAKLADIKKFLGYSSATKTGIKKVFKKRQKTYKTKFGISLKMEDMNDFFNSEEFLRAHEQLDGYTSGTYMRAIGQIQKNEKKILDAIKKNKEINLNIDDDAVNEAVNHLLSKYGKGVVDLY